MTRKEISKAIAILAGRTDRTETIIDGIHGGQLLTAYWIDGGQRLFRTLGEVEQWAADRTSEQVYLAD